MATTRYTIAAAGTDTELVWSKLASARKEADRRAAVWGIRVEVTTTTGKLTYTGVPPFVPADLLPGQQRPGQAATSADGWELLYDKSHASTFVVRSGRQYAVMCTECGTLELLGKLKDERVMRRIPGGWCPTCRESLAHAA